MTTCVPISSQICQGLGLEILKSKDFPTCHESFKLSCASIQKIEREISYRSILVIVKGLQKQL